MRPLAAHTKRTLTTTFGIALLAAAITIPLSAADWNAGVAAYKAGELQRAIDEFTGYVEARPDVFQGHQMLGLALYKNGDVDRAAAHFARATELAPERPDLRILWARALDRNGDVTAACDVLSSLDATTLDEQNAKTLLQLRAKAACGGDRLSALGDLARAADDATTWAAYASAALTANDAETARDAAATAALKSPDNPKVQRLYARALLASAAETTGDERATFYAQAVEPARTAFAGMDDLTSALVYSEALLGNNRFTDAERPITRALELDPDNWNANFNMARVEANREATDAAIARFDRAVELAPSDDARTLSLKSKAQLLEAADRYTEAAAVFSEAGASDDAARNLENAKIAEENADAEDFNRRRAELIKQRAEAEEELKRMREGGPPPID